MGLPIGFRFKPTQPLPSGDTTIGKEYVIAGRDSDGDDYFVDDSGEQNFSMSAGGGLLWLADAYTVVE